MQGVSNRAWARPQPRPATQPDPTSVYSDRPASASPRRSANCSTRQTQTRPSSAVVTTSPIFTAWPGATTRPPLIRTRPPLTRAAAALRVLTIRACHSHLSMRCRSMARRLAAARSGSTHGLALLLGAALELFLERSELGKWRIRIDRPLTGRTRREVAITALLSALVAIAVGPVAATLVTLAMRTARSCRRRGFG